MTIADTPMGKPVYARFMLRLRAVCFDSIVIMLIMVAALVVATTFASDNVARVLGFTFIAVWLLYEPLLVSSTGSTIGHYLCNIRVVDDRAGGNVGLGRAILRTIIKTLLGWYSFVTMATTSRHQAIHDLATRSTMQIRDLTKAQPYDFHSAREPLPSASMPSGGRRALAISGYVIAAFLLSVALQSVLAGLGLMTARCLDGGFCSAQENIILDGIMFGWLAISAVLIVAGWRGRLWGTRRARLG